MMKSTAFLAKPQVNICKNHRMNLLYTQNCFPQNGHDGEKRIAKIFYEVFQCSGTGSQTELLISRSCASEIFSSVPMTVTILELTILMFWQVSLHQHGLLPT